MRITELLSDMLPVEDMPPEDVVALRDKCRELAGLPNGGDFEEIPKEVRVAIAEQVITPAQKILLARRRGT